MQRLRLTFAKTGAMRYTGHLDLHKALERTFRRAQLPLAYSEGFNPHPRLQLGAALPLGFTSDCEMADVWLETPQDLAAAHATLTQALPPGIVLKTIEEVPLSAAATQTLVRAAEFRVELSSTLPRDEIETRVAALLAAPEIRRVRREKEYDLRPLIEALTLTEAQPAPDPGETLYTFHMRLAAREGATGRPEEVLAALALPGLAAAYHRETLHRAETA